MRNDRHPQPILIRADEVMNVDRAAQHARRNPKTIRIWCRRFGIGRQSCDGGPMEVSRIGLEMVLHGDTEALELLRSGDRSSKEVIRYFDFAGIKQAI